MIDLPIIKELKQRLAHYCQHGLTIDRPHQIEAHQAVRDGLAEMTNPKDFWSLMVMATGSGKSFTAGKQVKAFNTPAGAMNPTWDFPVLVVTSRITLTNQLLDSFSGLAGIKESEIGVFSAASKARSQLDRPVLIVPYPSFLNLSRSGAISPENRPIVILDEAHGALGDNVSAEIKKKWVGKSYVQCWTATDKLPRKTVAQVLFGSSTGRDVDDATYRLTLKQAAERDIVAPIKSMVLETEFSSGAKPTEAGHLTDEAIEKIVNQKGRMEALIRLCHGDYTEKFGVNFSGMRTIIFSPLVKHAQRVAEEFNKIFGPGYAVVVSGDTNPKEMDLKKPDSIVSRFTRGDRSLGDPKIIINSKYIEEGADIPAAELVVEEVPTFSERVETQRVGRVARKWDGNPNKIAYSVVMLDKDHSNAAIIGEMEGWELKPESFEFPKPPPLPPVIDPDAPPPHDPTPPSPPLPVEYPDIPVHVIANAKEIGEFQARKLDEAERKNKSKPAGYWSSDEFAGEIGRLHTELKKPISVAQNIMRNIRDQLETKETAIYNGVSVPREAVAEYIRYSQPAYAIREAEAKALAAAYQPEIGAPVGYWPSEKLGQAIRAAHPEITDAMGTGTRIIGQIRQLLQEEEERLKKARATIDGQPQELPLKEEIKILYKGIPIPKEAITEYTYRGNTAYALRESEAKQIVAVLEVEERGVPEGFWSGPMLGAAINEVRVISNPDSYGSTIIGRLREEVLDTGTAKFVDVTVSADDLKDYIYNSKTCFSISQEKGQDIADTFEQDKNLPEGYISSKMLGNMIKKVDDTLKDPRGTAKMLIASLRDQFKTQETAKYKTLTIHKDAVKQYGSALRPSYALRKKEADLIIASWHIKTEHKPDVQEGYWSARELGMAIEQLMSLKSLTLPQGAQAIGTSIITFLRSKLGRKSGKPDYKGVPLPSDTILQYQHNGRPAYAIKQEVAEQIAEAYVADKAPTPGTFPGDIEPKDLKPGGRNLERTGSLSK